MGCFNMACHISRLPIIHREKARAIFLLPFPKYGSDRTICYTTDHFAPWTLPVAGTYDDYGRLENIVMTPSTKALEAKFLKAKEKSFTFTDEERDDPKNLSEERLELYRRSYMAFTNRDRESSWDSKESAIHNVMTLEPRIAEYPSFIGDAHNMSPYVLIREEVYTTIAKKSLPPTKYRELKAHFGEELDKWFEHLCAIWVDVQATGMENASIEYQIACNHTKFESHDYDKLDNFYLFERHYVDKNHMRFYAQEIMDGIKSGWHKGSPAWKTWRKEFIDFFMVLYTLSWLDIPWNIKMVSGQCFDMETWQTKQRFNQMVADIAGARIKERKAEGW